MSLKEEVTESGITRMPVSRALARLKTLKAKIEQQVDEPVKFFHISQGVEKPRMLTPGETFESAKAKAQGHLDSLLKNMSNYIAIKEAIARSNATTEVVINGKTYTVAGAMELKKIQAYKIKIASRIKNQHTEISTVINRSNEKLIAEMNGDKSDNKNALDEETQVKLFEKLQTIQRELSMVELVDTIGYADVIKNITDEVDAVKTDLDYVLNESNMVTIIEVDLR